MPCISAFTSEFLYIRPSVTARRGVMLCGDEAQEHDSTEGDAGLEDVGSHEAWVVLLDLLTHLGEDNDCLHS